WNSALDDVSIPAATTFLLNTTNTGVAGPWAMKNNQVNRRPAFEVDVRGRAGHRCRLSGPIRISDYGFARTRSRNALNNIHAHAASRESIIFRCWSVRSG